MPEKPDPLETIWAKCSFGLKGPSKEFLKDLTETVGVPMPTEIAFYDPGVGLSYSELLDFIKKNRSQFSGVDIK
jgi:hypothetical protein